MRSRAPYLLRAVALLAALAILAIACGGGDDDSATTSSSSTAVNDTLPPASTRATLAPPSSQVTATSTPVTEPPDGCGALTLSGEPLDGTISLAAGFAVDPQFTAATAGGCASMGSAPIGCSGFTATQPTVRLQYSGSSPFLRIFFVPDAGGDTTLAVNDPTETWHCGDDEFSLDPAVDIFDAPSGVYDIFVGTFFEDADLVPGTLFFTEFDDRDPTQPFGPEDTPVGIFPEGSRLDFTLEPAFGNEFLNAGFVPDPHEVLITSGGPADAAVEAGPGCAGFLAFAPDYRLEWSGESSLLRFGFDAEDGVSDATLVILDPLAQVVCDDDSGPGLDPELVFVDPPVGVYDVWVGSFSASEFINGTLLISEFAS